MKIKIDLTNWSESVNFVVNHPDREKSKYWKKEVNLLRETIKDEMNYLWDHNKINTRKWDDCCWDNDINREFKEFFNVSNEFMENSKVDDKDYSLTDYELIKKYGKDWHDDNFYSTVISIKEKLSIDQLLELASLMQRKYYSFWSYEIDNEGFINPEFHQYDTTEYSEYLKDLKAYENFEVEVLEENPSRKQKLTM